MSIWLTLSVHKDAMNAINRWMDDFYANTGKKDINIVEKLYEDNASGKVSDEWFLQLSHKYEVERMELKSKLSEIRNKLKDLGAMEQNKDMFLAAIRRFMDPDHLTAPLLRELIDRIEVHETEGTGKHRTQRITIYYKFVGYIDIPECCDFHIAETRQGVAVTYLTQSA